VEKGKVVKVRVCGLDRIGILRARARARARAAKERAAKARVAKARAAKAMDGAGRCE